jgi:hypothetical protein
MKLLTRASADFRLPIVFAFIVLAVLIGVLLRPALAEDGSMTVQAWYAYVCGDDGAVFKFLAHYVMYPAFVMVAATFSANSKTVQALPVVGPLVRVVGGHWAAWLRVAALKAAASKNVILAIVGLSFVVSVLTACTAAQVQSSAQDVAGGCAVADAAAQDAQARLSGGARDTADGIIVYEKAVCGSAAGIAKAAQDPSTAAWLANITESLKSLAEPS